MLLGRSASDSKRQSVLLLDGGVSTHLQDKIDPASFRCRQLWSSSLLLESYGRQVVLEGHKDWIKAGADIISTVTYQCHYEQELWPKCDDGTIALLGEQMDDMFRDGVSLARQAQRSSDVPPSRETFVAASLGCYGAALANGAEYTGSYGSTTRAELMQFHRRKAEQAALHEPDAIAFETVPSYLECLALRDLLEDASWLSNVLGKTAYWISLACNGLALNDGTPLLDVLNALTSIPADHLQGIGLNCCAVEHLPGLVTILVQYLARLDVPTRAILLYPNTGESWDAGTESWKAGTGCTAANDFCNHLMSAAARIEQEWPKDAGRRPVIVLGGCCRTRPDAIAELRRRLDTALA